MTFLDELKNADAEERAELEACGIVYQVTRMEGEVATGFAISSTGDTAAQTDAVVSQLQRRMIGLDEDRQRYIDAMTTEMQFVARRYDAMILPIAQQYARTEAIVLDIAEHAGFDKAKKKSRSTPYGVYGIRHQAEKVEIIDPAATLAWAQENAPEIVDQPDPKPQPARVLHAALCEFREKKTRIDVDGVVFTIAIPGVVTHPEHDKPYVKLAKEGA